jgi:hypothetical protein
VIAAQGLHVDSKSLAQQRVGSSEIAAPHQ